MLEQCRISDRAAYLERAVNEAKQNKGIISIPPYQIDIEPTKKCNLKCTLCSRNYWNEELNRSVDIPWDIFEKVLPLLQYSTLSAIQGLGEPLLGKSFFDIVKTAVSHGVITQINSNCTQFTDDACKKLIESGLGGITLSIDGVKSLEGLRGVAFKVVKENVERLIRLKKKTGSNTPYLSVEVVVSLLNVGELVKVVKLAKKWGIRSVYVFHPEIYHSSLREYSIYNNVALAEKEFAKAQQVASRANIKLDLPSLDQKSPLSFNEGSKTENITYCDYPFHYLMVNNAGNVTTCCIGCVDDISNSVVVGNLNEESIESIWNGERIRELRLRMLENKPTGLCAVCPMKGHSIETYTRYFKR